jgi:hypothetical protein
MALKWSACSGSYWGARARIVRYGVGCRRLGEVMHIGSSIKCLRAAPFWVAAEWYTFGLFFHLPFL